MKFKYLLLLFAISFYSITYSQVMINEFSAANYNDVTDNHSEYEDWIELYNAGATSVDLTGFHLSDRADDPAKWEIPSGISISAGGVLRFWCSSRDAIEGSNYHTNFKLTQTNGAEAVVFSDVSGTIIDQNEIEIANQKNHSWGRYPDGLAMWYIFTDPTPNALNTTSHYEAYAEKPNMEPNAGSFTGSVTVTISVTDPLLTIRYTLDGKAPTSSSTAYTSALTIDETTVVRCAAFSSDADVKPSFNSTNTYFIDEDITIPIMSIAGDNVDELLEDGDSWTYNNTIGSFELFDADFNLIDEAEGTYNEHGNDSWAYPQRGFDWIVRDQFGYDSDIDHEFFSDVTDRTSYQRLIVKAAANDNYPESYGGAWSGGGAHVRDAYVHHLAQLGGLVLDERTTFFCIVFLNGEYWGVYDAREKADDADYTDYYYGQDELDMDYIKCWGGTWAEYGVMDEWYPLADYITTEDMTIAANYTYATDNLEIYSLMDYVILNTMTVCTDWLNWNTAWWRGYNEDGTHKKWGYVLWDEDATFGHYINYTGVPDDSPTADPCDPLTLGTTDPNGHIDVLNALLENEDFFALYVNRFADLLNSTFSCDFMLNALDSMKNVIDPEMDRHTDKWGGSYSDWEDNYNNLHDFISDRCTFLTEGIEDCFDTPAYPITIDVVPSGAGNLVQISTFTPTTYSFDATYFGGITLPIKAIPASGYIFDHWEFLHNIPSPSTTVDSVSVNLTSSDTIVAHFIESVMPNYNFTLDIIPTGAGNVSVNAFTPGTYPYATSFVSGTLLNMDASANADYIFDYWELDYHVVNPDPFAVHVNFALTGLENVAAHFKLANAIGDLDNVLVNLIVSPTVTNGNINITYQLSQAQNISLELYSVTGNKLADIIPANSNTPRGEYNLNVDLNTYNVAQGMYFIKMSAADKNITQRIVFAQ
ncbi:MAG: CotH kinase family protein [Fimbriimonadaceae bacterium]|nr:CotH kinase family protein [Chitinophagales bacterium]